LVEHSDKPLVIVNADQVLSLKIQKSLLKNEWFNLRITIVFKGLVKFLFIYINFRPLINL